MAILELNHIHYSYLDGMKKVLKDVNAEFEQGKIYAIIGSSGAGKTTLLSLLAGLDVPESGVILFDKEDISKNGYAYHRKKQISLVFQNYNLIDYLTPLENLQLVNKNASKDLLLQLGLSEDECNRNVLKLSGGQQQRVAIARTLAADTPIILADEPTGNLDEDTAEEIMKILQNAAHKENKCVIVVTHSMQAANKADVVLRLKNGKLI